MSALKIDADGYDDLTCVRELAPAPTASLPRARHPSDANTAARRSKAARVAPGGAANATHYAASLDEDDDHLHHLAELDALRLFAGR